MATFVRACNSSISIISKFLKPRIDISYVPNRGRYSMNKPPTKKYPPWLPKQYRVLQKEDITRENTKFIDEVIASKYAPRNLGIDSTVCNSPLKSPPIEPQTWCPDSRRTGVIAKKIGIYPLWLKNGKKVLSTLLQVIDNHVIKYIPPEEHNPMIGGRHRRPRRRLGCLVVGADSTDPQRFTKEYCGMFTDAGVMPKKLLTRFNITPDGALQPGTPLYAAHFKPGEVVDIRAKTMDRGFQGVMKRWGFHGMPATHGVTKTHRRPGNIGSGGTKARVMPGTKMPGHMGNRYRVFRGLKVLRVNTKYNVLWVLGQALPGETNSLLQIYDTLLTRRKLKQPPHFPTYMPTDEQSLEEELYDDDVQPFGADSLKFEPEA